MKGFRPDVEGLRAVAVLLVLAYHAGAPFVPNGFVGVDVFFVVSGFLITGLLLRELDDTGRISWPRFVARRIRRLLPAAGAVLVSTAVVAWFVVPAPRLRGVGADVVAAALSVVNWVLADRSVDYLAGDALAPPVQHFWSLAVEEQFYVVWPLCLGALALLARRRGHRPSARSVGLLLAALCGPSFIWSVWLTATDPDRAYFVTTTRVWELGVGAALAVALHGRAPAPHRLAAPAGVAGLLAVVLASVWLPPDEAWPGAWALLPTVGTAGVLWAGWVGTSAVPRGLAVRPLVWVGGLSYSLYLWHWPVLVLAQWSLGPLGVPAKTALVLLSAVPAWASHRWLEQPLHHSRRLSVRPRRAFALGAACSALAVASGLPLATATVAATPGPPGGRVPAASEMGASVVGSPPSAVSSTYAVDEWPWLLPDPQAAGSDRPRADVDHCQVGVTSETPVRCQFGDPQGRRTVALVGDSKAMQWLPGLEVAAVAKGWRIVTYGKSSCTFADAAAQAGGRPYPSCDAWNRRVLALLARERPDVVLTSGHLSHAWASGAPSRDALVAGLARRWRAVEALGSQVVVVADNPNSPDDLDICAAANPGRLTACAFDREAAVAASGGATQRAAWSQAPDVAFLDLTLWLCPVERCPVAIGNVVVNRSGDHVTATYAKTLAPQLRDAVSAALRE